MKAKEILLEHLGLDESTDTLTAIKAIGSPDRQLYFYHDVKTGKDYQVYVTGREYKIYKLEDIIIDKN